MDQAGPSARADDGGFSASPPIADDADDAALAELGYDGRLRRALKGFDAFAISFSNASVTTGVFIALGATYAIAGPAGIWMSLIDVLLMGTVALVYASLASRIPLTGLEYQWASRLAGPIAGAGIGWLWFAAQTIALVSVDYTLASTVLPALFGYVSGTIVTLLVTGVIIVMQALLLGASVRLTARVNNVVVIAELVVVIGLTILLIVVGAIRGLLVGHNLWSTAGTGHGYFRIAGAHGVGSFWLVITIAFFSIGNGFQGAGNGAEETHDPRRVIPRAMLRSLVVSGVAQVLFLVALAVVSHRVDALANSPTAVADIIQSVLGRFVTKLFLVVIVFNVFACGLVLGYQQIRYAWAMSRDHWFAGTSVLSPTNERTRTPVRATVVCALLCLAVLAAFGSNANAFDDLIGASGLVTIIAYLAVMLVSLLLGRAYAASSGGFDLGRWRRPVTVVAIVWLAFALSVFRSGFSTAWEYTGAVVVVGVVFVGIGAIRPHAARSGETAESNDRREPGDRAMINSAGDR
jgi:amino acid transporter